MSQSDPIYKFIIILVILTMRTFLMLLLAMSFYVVYGQRYVYISKQQFYLCVIENKDTVFRCPIAVGKNMGNKEKKGDMKTPEGRFVICSIENSSSWKHDFKDGKGVRKGAYGPYFFRLKVPKFKSIGIHGTCKPESIGKRDSEGCIRLLNADLKKLRNFVYLGIVCIIERDNVEE